MKMWALKSYVHTENQQKFTVKKVCGLSKQQILNRQKFSNSYPLSTNTFNMNIYKVNIFTQILANLQYIHIPKV